MPESLHHLGVPLLGVLDSLEGFQSAKWGLNHKAPAGYESLYRSDLRYRLRRAVEFPHGISGDTMSIRNLGLSEERKQWSLLHLIFLDSEFDSTSCCISGVSYGLYLECFYQSGYSVLLKLG